MALTIDIKVKINMTKAQQIVVNGFTNALDIFEQIIPNYPVFDNYVDKWIYYKETKDVPYNDKMTDSWDGDANKYTMDYFNQLFGGTAVQVK